MFNIGFTELIILAVIGLLVIGPEQLPEMARKIARMLNELKRAKDEIMEPVNELKNQAQNAILKTRREVDDQFQSKVTEILNMKNENEGEHHENEDGHHENEDGHHESEDEHNEKKSIDDKSSKQE